MRKKLMFFGASAICVLVFIFGICIANAGHKIPAGAPNEFRDIAKALSGTELEINPRMMHHRLLYQLDYSPEENMFIFFIRGLREDSIKDGKKIMKVFFPTSYNQVNKYIDEALKNYKNTSGVVLDGKKINIKRYENALRVVITKE